MRFPPGFSIAEKYKNKMLEGNDDDWGRPDWFKSADYMRKVVWSDTEQIFEDNSFGSVDSYIMCPICRQKCAYMGAEIDHVIPWKEYAKRLNATNYYELKTCYHDLNNLILMHGNCNAHKKKPSLAATLARHHTSKQTATWNRVPEIATFCTLVEILYKQENVSVQLQQHIQNNIVKRFNKGGWHENNAYQALRMVLGDGAVNKAIQTLTQSSKKL